MIGDVTCNQVSFERGVFTSSGSSSVRGYHLVARSPGIDDDVAQALCQWSPTHDGLFDSSLSASALNYFLIGDRHFAISKSMVGGAEYSGRNALQTSTSILVGEREDLSNYGHNPVELARMALSMGLLRLAVDYEGRLEVAELSGDCLPGPTASTAASFEIVKMCVGALNSGGRIAIAGATNPIQLLSVIFANISPELRITTSFSTGLKASSFRPFQIQFFAKIDNRLRDFLGHQHIKLLHADLNS